MAVELIATIQKWQGLEADVKPRDVPIGSTFLELDGRKRDYVYTLEGWERTDAAIQSTAHERNVLELLARIADNTGQLWGLEPGETL